MVSIAINGLTSHETNSPWQQLTTSLMVRETTPTYEELSALLLQEEKRRQAAKMERIENAELLHVRGKSDVSQG